MDSQLLLLVLIFFVIAVVYSSAGFGGGSSYLAVLSLFPFDFVDIRIIALVCNIVVVIGSVFLFYNNGYLKLKRIWPLILFSIPMAFLGGRYQIDERIFFLILGMVLLIAALLMLFRNNMIEIESKRLPKLPNGIIGGGIGFLSGLVGIGGGVFLSPVLHLTRWNETKVIAATTALFILVNSLAGLAGQLASNPLNVDIKILLILISVVFIGGQVGSRISIKKWLPSTVKKVTGFLILIVAIRILFQWF